MIALLPRSFTAFSQMSTQGKCILCDAISHKVESCPSLQTARAAISMMRTNETGVDIQYLNRPAEQQNKVVFAQGKHGTHEVYSELDDGTWAKVIHRGKDHQLTFTGSVKITVEYGLAEVPLENHPDIMSAYYAARIIELDEDDLTTTAYVETSISPTATLGSERVTGFQPF